jgi:hypothetical protein
MASSSCADDRRTRAVALAAIALAVLAAAAGTVLAARSSDARPVRLRAAGGAFSVLVPAGWRALDARELRALPSSPAAVLRRADGQGTVVVRRRPALATAPRTLPRALVAALGRRLRGVAPVASRTVALRGGPAYVLTFARPAARAVQSIAVAPRAGRTWTLDAVTGAGAPDAAVQVGAILGSFDTTTAPRS